MNLPLVSVIVPTYNRKEMLKQALDSVLAQDYPNMEIIVGDNASADGTHLIMEGYCKQYSFIKYIRRPENIGAHPNGYLAFKESASGKYIYFLSDDDFLMSPTFLSHAVNVFEVYPKVKIVSGIVLMLWTKTNSFTTIQYTAKKYIKGYSFMIHMWTPHLWGKYNELIGQFFMVRRQDLEALECFEWFHYGDTSLKYCLPLKGDVYFLHELVGCYRMHEGERDANNLIKIKNELKNICRFICFVSQKAAQAYPTRSKFFAKHLARKVLDNTVTNMFERCFPPLSLSAKKEMWFDTNAAQQYPEIYQTWLKLVARSPLFSAWGIRSSIKMLIKGMVSLALSLCNKFLSIMGIGKKF